MIIVAPPVPFSLRRRVLRWFIVPKPVKVCSEAPMVGEHLSQVIVDFTVCMVNPVINLRDETCVHFPFSDVCHFSYDRWRLSCLIIFRSSCYCRMLLRCSYSCFLSTASISMGIRPAMIYTVSSSDTVRKALDILRALSWLTAVILRRYFSILKASQDDYAICEYRSHHWS